MYLRTKVSSIILTSFRQGSGNLHLGKDIERQKAIGKRLDCTFIRINFDSLKFDGDREINGVFCQMKQSIKKKFVDETTSRLLSL